MVSALDFGASGPGSSPDGGHCILFLSKTLNSHAPLSTQVYKWVPANLMLESDPTMDQHPIQGRMDGVIIKEKQYVYIFQ